MLAKLIFSLTVLRFAVGCNCFICLVIGFVDIDIASVVEFTEHVKKNASVEGEEEVDELRVVAIAEHQGEVVVEDYAELDQLH